MCALARVAQFCKNSVYRYSGYVVSLFAERLGPGTHTLTIKVLVSGAQAYDEPSWSTVVVIPAAQTHIDCGSVQAGFHLAVRRDV